MTRSKESEATPLLRFDVLFKLVQGRRTHRSSGEGDSENFDESLSIAERLAYIALNPYTHRVEPPRFAIRYVIEDGEIGSWGSRLFGAPTGLTRPIPAIAVARGLVGERGLRDLFDSVNGDSIRRVLVSAEYLPQWFLEGLTDHSDVKIRQLVASRAPLPDVVLETLVLDPAATVRREVYAHHWWALSPVMLAPLLKDRSRFIRDDVRRYRRWDVTRLDAAPATSGVQSVKSLDSDMELMTTLTATQINSGHPDLGIGIAHHPEAPDRALELLAESDCVEIRRACAIRPALPAGICELLAADEDHIVRRAVAGQQNLSKASISALANDGDCGVVGRLFSRIDPEMAFALLDETQGLRHERHFERRGWDRWWEQATIAKRVLTEREDVSDEQLLEWARRGDDRLAELLAERVDLPESAALALATRPESRVREATLEREDIATLLGSPVPLIVEEDRYFRVMGDDWETLGLPALSARLIRLLCWMLANHSKSGSRDFDQEREFLQVFSQVGAEDQASLLLLADRYFPAIFHRAEALVDGSDDARINLALAITRKTSETVAVRLAKNGDPAVRALVAEARLGYTALSTVLDETDQEIALTAFKNFVSARWRNEGPDAIADTSACLRDDDRRARLIELVGQVDLSARVNLMTHLMPAVRGGSWVHYIEVATAAGAPATIGALGGRASGPDSRAFLAEALDDETPLFLALALLAFDRKRTFEKDVRARLWARIEQHLPPTADGSDLSALEFSLALRAAGDEDLAAVIGHVGRLPLSHQLVLAVPEWADPSAYLQAPYGGKELEWWSGWDGARPTGGWWTPEKGFVDRQHRAVVKVQRRLLPHLGDLAEHARAEYLIEARPPLLMEVIERHFAVLTESDRVLLRDYWDPLIRALVRRRERRQAPIAEADKVENPASQAIVSKMNLDEKLDYLGDEVLIPTHTAEVVESDVIEPTKHLSQRDQALLALDMTALTLMIASNPGALRALDGQLIMKMLDWHDGAFLRLGWEEPPVVRGDRWLIEEALAANKDVLPDAIVRILEASSNRRVRWLLRSPAPAPAFDIDVIAKAGRGDFSDGDFAALVESRDSDALGALVGNDALLEAVRTEDLVNMVARLDPRGARALAAKAGGLDAPVQVALASSRLFVARRALAGLGPEVLSLEVRELLKADSDEQVQKVVAKWGASPAAGRPLGSQESKSAASRSRQARDARGPDKTALLALIADDAALKALSVDEQIALAKHDSVDVPRALAKRADLLDPKVHAVLAESRIFTARRELVRVMGSRLDAAILERLSADDDGVVRRIAEAAAAKQ